MFADLSSTALVLILLGAFIIGLSKTGIPGLGILFVGIFAQILPPRESVGVVLPLLICGDIAALILYRRNVRWSMIWRLFPWTALGVIIGTFALGVASDSVIARLIGAILAVLLFLHLRGKWRQANSPQDGETPPAQAGRWWFSGGTGLAAGFTTMTANAAGPVMMLYLLSMRVPKKDFFGTAAIFFFFLNLFKVPFHLGIGTINTDTLALNLYLFPAVFLGAGLGRLILPYIRPTWFEFLALFFTALAALRLLGWG
ncbi:MAG: sulfite exporter TauE/SafE family protein [Opitutales bacterium]|nr:sulfite exporter TauE/SafE family protein [Opitutales bacterium]MCH8539914.1 sulfite exporter TauE/SafE family protein [Opitutales bacterium]